MYEYHETRGGDHAEEFLVGFKGYLQSDAYAGYNWADQNNDIISVGCHTHARRPFAELVKLAKGTSLASEAIKFYQKLYKVEKQAREIIYRLRHDMCFVKKNQIPFLMLLKSGSIII